MIIDSNLIIYAALPQYPGLRRFIAENKPAVSAISVVEVLGYHKLIENDRQHYEAFFTATEILPVSEAVVFKAVILRQARKMTLGDALIAAAGLVFERKLYTHNTKDFIGIPGLEVIDPIANGDPP